MKINSISANSFYTVNCNKNRNIANLNRQVSSDCFIKSNEVTFCARSSKDERKQKVDSFVMDMSSKAYSAKFSIRDIANSMSKYAKNVNVKPMSQAPKELLFSDGLQGLYCEELDFDENSNRFIIPKKNRVFYTRTETLNKDFGNVWCIVNAAHELTHALQSDGSDFKQVELFNTYVDKNRNDIDSALGQITAVVGTVNTIEENIARPFINLLVQNQERAYNRVQDGFTNVLSWLCKKSGTENFGLYVREKVNESIKTSEEKHGINIDKSLLFDATINHFEKEIEAYESEGRTFKKFIGIDSPRALARVQIYQKSIDVLNEMKKEL